MSWKECMNKKETAGQARLFSAAMRQAHAGETAEITLFPVF